MKQLTCEMCGSTDLLKQDGVFICQNCGTKYTVDEAKKMMIEGTVQVDNSNLIGNYLKLAATALEGKNYRECISYCNKVLEIEPIHIKALVTKIDCLSKRNISDEQIIPCCEEAINIGVSDENDIYIILTALSEIIDKAVRNPDRSSGWYALNSQEKYLANLIIKLYENADEEYFIQPLQVMVALGYINYSILYYMLDKLNLSDSSKISLYQSIIRHISKIKITNNAEYEYEKHDMNDNNIYDEYAVTNELISKDIKKIQDILKRFDSSYNINDDIIKGYELAIKKFIDDFIDGAESEGSIFFINDYAYSNDLDRIEEVYNMNTIEGLTQFYYDVIKSGDSIISMGSLDSISYHTNIIIKEINKLQPNHKFNDEIDKHLQAMKIAEAKMAAKREAARIAKANNVQKAAPKKSKGCYVATCVYGSYDCPEVWTLRRFRDYTLSDTWYGRAFIKLYYTVSPTLVKWFGNTNWFKGFWKKYLDKVVKNLNKQGFDNTKYNDTV